ncbi:MAG: hypothetical protein FJ264_03890 [Planctomycetes bacterium]|nr:hypothetical protein [Planctomycetota bacterium]
MFIKSPNRFHHKPYVDKILECKDKWELYELIMGIFAEFYKRFENVQRLPLIGEDQNTIKYGVYCAKVNPR